MKRRVMYKSFQSFCRVEIIAEEKRKGIEEFGSMPATELGSKCFGCYTRFFQGRYLTLMFTIASIYSQ